LVYNFSNSVVGDVSGAPAGASAGDFSGGGSVGANAWNTGALSSPVTNTFTFTVGPVPVVLDKLSIVARKGIDSFSVVPGYQVSYKIDGGSSVNLFDNGPAFTFNNASSPSMGVALSSGSTVEFTIVSSMLVGAATFIEFDSISLSGGAVPEPASMAIFGLMGAGLAVRRFRRK
jgi:hypothetical protein